MFRDLHPVLRVVGKKKGIDALIRFRFRLLFFVGRWWSLSLLSRQVKRFDNIHNWFVDVMLAPGEDM
jgi:hypothetical protein